MGKDHWATQNKAVTSYSVVNIDGNNYFCHSVCLVKDDEE